jgi:hypothetical protein
MMIPGVGVRTPDLLVTSKEGKDVLDVLRACLCKDNIDKLRQYMSAFFTKIC